jgi:hypothetical protein
MNLTNIPYLARGRLQEEALKELEETGLYTGRCLTMASLAARFNDLNLGVQLICLPLGPRGGPRWKLWRVEEA